MHPSVHREEMDLTLTKPQSASLKMRETSVSGYCGLCDGHKKRYFDAKKDTREGTYGLREAVEGNEVAK